jgi:hypothetical protein
MIRIRSGDIEQLAEELGTLSVGVFGVPSVYPRKRPIPRELLHALRTLWTSGGKVFRRKPLVRLTPYINGGS